MQYCLKLKSVVGKSDEGLCLIDMLSRRFSYRTAEFWAQMIDAGRVRVSGRQISSETKLAFKDEVAFEIPDFYEPDLNLNYKKIWENENLILVSKPADLPVHSNRRFYYQTMTAVLRRDEADDSINPLHRLDRETSGLILYLRKPFLAGPLKKHPEKIISQKIYLAVVYGSFRQDFVELDAPLKACDKPPVSYQMYVCEDGLPARSLIFRIGASENFSLLMIKIETGRRHQIRAHLAHLGFPVVGDKLYAFGGKYFMKRCNDDLSEDDLVEMGSPHHLLHAWCLKAVLEKSESHIFFSDFFSDSFSGFLELFPDWRAKAADIVTGLDQG